MKILHILCEGQTEEGFVNTVLRPHLMLFCGIDYLAKIYPKCQNRCKHLALDLQKVENPELINNGPSTAPSKRIISAIEGGKKQQYKYNKAATAKAVTEQIGIDELRSKCPHFNEWIENLMKKIMANWYDKYLIIYGNLMKPHK